jgi:uncharacterized protein (TIGR02391 family)
MHELFQIIPDAQVLLAMEPEELGAKILFLLRKRSEHSQQPFLFSNLIGELWPQHYPYLPGQQPPFPREQQNEINLALAEAWAWLVAQGLLVPAPEQHGGPDWRVLSRRARRFEDEAEFARYAVARMLPKEALHPRISNKVWSAFMRSEFDVAAFQAMKAVEVAVREASGLSNDLLGVKLMRKAFDPKDGPLSDMEAEDSEREARSALFAGAIGSYKNPHSHRDVQLSDPAEAVEIIMLANHLLRIVDARKKAKP